MDIARNECYPLVLSMGNLVKDGLKILREFDSGEQKESSYASIFWLCKPQSEQRLNVTFGWSLPDGLGGFFDGSWRVAIDCFPPFRPKGRHLALVEEPLGISFTRPTEAQEATNEHCERIIADNLLLFVHLALFNQCKDSLPIARNYLDKIKPINEILIFGPALPKFIGRICYSHLKREKTIAILCPDTLPNALPEQQHGGWPLEPLPPFWDDSAVRKWEKVKGWKSNEQETIASFELVVASGDGINAKRVGNQLAGPNMWNDKAQRIQQILSNSSESTVLGLWGNRRANLPKGMKKAVRAAFIANESIIAESDLDAISAVLQEHGGDFGTEDLDLIHEIVQQELESRRYPQDLAKLFESRIFHLYSSGKRAATGKKVELAARPKTAIRGRFKDLFAKAVNELKEELGADAF